MIIPVSMVFLCLSLEIADWRLRIADCQDNVLFFNLQSEIRNPQFHRQWRNNAG
jgi:hypothetical protein